MIGDFIIGFTYIPRGFAYIMLPGLRRYVALPILINVVLFLSAFVLLLERLGSWLDGLLPHSLSWLSWLILPLLFLALSLGVFYTFGLVANLIASPFNALLAENLELQMGGRPPSAGAGFKATLRSALIGIATQLAALAYQLIRLVPLLVLFLVPIVNIAATSILILFSAWMLAIGYLSTPMGNHDMSFREVRAICAQRKGLVLGLGTGLVLLTWIPLLNLLVLPAGTAAATALWHEKLAHLRHPSGHSRP
ncbi:hypothetical protein BJI67_07240 [Acidihalobacter aeolianus]|uniref:Sulfate transporter CysZ n=1 Tax=Acidihalobacter aeolianus TaxID=2792603 RepID=A0A1D8K7E2_9GAMM|nr:sulfate transporter CysZ [Acidihalobacter aeolianus]AOV16883.1 hypothetical protein BJI67_07240 [Acidihalobacter aeolianus]